jgi:hypothetical protein
MRKYKKTLIFVGILAALALLYGLTYIPHTIVNIKPDKVSSIKIFDGNTGFETEITDKIAIQYIINNLNDVTFQKDKWAFLYMGYSFRTTIYNDQGKPVKQLIINSADTIRYKGFFYKAKGNQIDYEYIRKAVGKQP